MDPVPAVLPIFPGPEHVSKPVDVRRRHWALTWSPGVGPSVDHAQGTGLGYTVH